MGMHGCALPKEILAFMLRTRAWTMGPLCDEAHRLDQSIVIHAWPIMIICASSG